MTAREKDAEVCMTLSHSIISIENQFRLMLVCFLQLKQLERCQFVSNECATSVKSNLENLRYNYTNRYNLID